jgi:hypothetical protein
MRPSIASGPTDGKKIVAVKPTAAFADLFVPGNTNTAAPEETTVLKVRERRDSNPRPPA